MNNLAEKLLGGWEITNKTGYYVRIRFFRENNGEIFSESFWQGFSYEIKGDYIYCTDVPKVDYLTTYEVLDKFEYGNFTAKETIFHNETVVGGIFPLYFSKIETLDLIL